MIIACTEEISFREGYEAALALIFYYWKLTPVADLTDILSGGEYIELDSPLDSAFWLYWLDEVEHIKEGGISINILAEALGLAAPENQDSKEMPACSNSISKKMAYEAMIYMYYIYWEDTSSDDLSLLLTQYVVNGSRFFFWDKWLNSIAFVQQNGPKYKEYIT